MNKNDRWSQLSMQQRADLIRLYISNGITSLDSIKKDYNSFAPGGPIETGKKTMLDPQKIVHNVPAREWGPYTLNENYELIEKDGTSMGRALFQYLGNKGKGADNIEFAKQIISDFEKKIKGNPNYNIVLDPNYESYVDAIHYLDHVEGLKKYLGLPYNTKTIVESNYKPTRLQGTDEKTYKFTSSMQPSYWDEVVDDMLIGERSKKQYEDQTLNTFTAYRDRDNKGDFVSIYDEWDYNPAVRGGNKNFNKVIDIPTGGKPFVVYDRIYLDDYFNIPEEARGNPFITPAVVTAEYKHGGRILDGTEIEQTLSGNTIDTSKRLESREEYLNKQRETIRLQALQNSLNRTEPSNPIFDNPLTYEEWEQDRLARLDEMTMRLLNAQTDDEAKMYNLSIRGIQNETYSPTIVGNNCIFTALDNYGRKYKVSGNLSFLANPEKYGFKEVKTTDIKPGDLIQKELSGNNHHMMVFDSYDDTGLPLYNYSSSSSKNSSDIHKKHHYYSEDINNPSNRYRAFTFVGNTEDNAMWNSNYDQYRKEYSSKVLEELKDVPKLPTDKARILDGTEDEQTTTGLPVGAGLATYNHPKYNHAEEAEMYSYLRSRGVPHVQASAIMGNIAVESMLNPEITQIGGGGGYGLIQATDRSRKKAFINYDGQPYEFGSNISPETQRQLDYIIDKGLNTQTRGEWVGNHNIGRASVARRKFLEATDVNKASTIFTENYLRPGKPHTKRRKSMSNYFNDNYGITERALEEFENSFLFQNN